MHQRIRDRLAAILGDEHMLVFVTSYRGLNLRPPASALSAREAGRFPVRNRDRRFDLHGSSREPAHARLRHRRAVAEGGLRLRLADLALEASAPPLVR